MVTSPSGEQRILSSPRGPSEVRRVDATLRAARMCDCYTQISNSFIVVEAVTNLVCLKSFQAFLAILLSKYDKRSTILVKYN